MPEGETPTLCSCRCRRVPNFLARQDMYFLVTHGDAFEKKTHPILEAVLLQCGASQQKDRSFEGTVEARASLKSARRFCF